MGGVSGRNGRQDGDLPWRFPDHHGDVRKGHDRAAGAEADRGQTRSTAVLDGRGHRGKVQGKTGHSGGTGRTDGDRGLQECGQRQHGHIQQQDVQTGVSPSGVHVHRRGHASAGAERAARLPVHRAGKDSTLCGEPDSGDGRRDAGRNGLL